MHALVIPFWCTCFVLASSLVAQAPTLPRLLRLGPVPEARTILVRPDGARGLEELADSVARVVLRIDAATRADIVTAVLHAAAAKGVRTVHFLATLPDGTVGTFALGLADEATPDLTLSLRAHHLRPGVPANSVLPVLQQLRRGWEHPAGRRFALDLEVPGDATCQQLLSLLAVAAEAGIQSVVPRSVTTARAAAPTELALDLVGAVRAQILATPAASPRPGLAAEAYGCPQIPPPRYGPQPDVPDGSEPTGLPAWLEPAPDGPHHWWQHQQRPDGAFVDDLGRADVEAVSLVALMTLADGCTLDAGLWRRELQRCIGWLIANQRFDGTFEDTGPGSVQRHAQATWALAEAAGQSASGDLLRFPTEAALRWLLAARLADGGWGRSRDASSDPVATAWAICAIAAAEHFGFEVPHRAAALVSWFDQHGRDEPLPAAAELLARFVAGQDPTVVPRMGQLVELLLTRASEDDPHTLFWTSYALWHHGGESWKPWQKRLEAAVVKKQVREGERKGSWEPAAGCTRITTNALHILTLQILYRYSRLLR